MTIERIVRIAFATVAAALLAGCVETRFESPLGDRIETCDARLKGLWVDTDGESKPGEGVFVDADCRVLILEQPEATGPVKQIHVPVNFVHHRGDDYLVIADNQLAGLGEKIDPPHGITPPPEKSFYFARYRVSGDRLDLYDVDSERVAKLVIDGTLEGTVSKTGSDLHVYVRGDRARMLEIVRKHKIFSDKPQMKLERRKQSLAEFERAAMRPRSEHP
jgi:hypothetical protein